YLSRLELKDNDIAVFIDIDDFKIFNDTYGHDAGDQLLVEFVKILREAKDEDLVIVRYGGDDFVIVLKNTVEVSVPLLMAHVKEALVTHFTDADFSYGYVKYTGELAETLIQADHQMYQMKRKRSKEQ
nr:GGDEF domain-containing protein [Vallitaleaceae bacterium]